MTDKSDDVTHRSSDPAFERLSNLKNLSLGLQVSKYLSSVRDCRSFKKNKMSDSLFKDEPKSDSLCFVK